MRICRLDSSDFLSDPIAQFSRWYREACSFHDKDPETPAAMALATATKSGLVSVRYVLFKGIDNNGFVFYTEYTSPKGRDLDTNPNAAIAFYWQELHRQVRISGKVEKLSAAQSDAYFAHRPRLSRIATTAYKQSRRIPLDSDLELICATIARSTRRKPIPRPLIWGGFRLVPHTIEFWQAGRYRIHDRFIYSRSGKKWKLSRLTP
jgi:pyridoxamine 5'-phosphate oxidase